MRYRYTLAALVTTLTTSPAFAVKLHIKVGK